MKENGQTRVVEHGHNGHRRNVNAFLNVAKENLSTDNSELSEELEALTRCTQETIAAVVPKKKKQKRNGRVMSQETKDLHEKRKKEFSKKKPTKEQRKRWNKKISRILLTSCGILCILRFIRARGLLAKCDILCILGKDKLCHIASELGEFVTLYSCKGLIDKLRRIVTSHIVRVLG